MDKRCVTGQHGRGFAVLAIEAPPGSAIDGDSVGLGLNVVVTLPSKVVTGMVPLYPYLSGIEGSKISVYTSCVT
jgi:hypothetical protein